MTTNEVQLTRLDGSVVWRVPVRSNLPPDVIAKGDFTADGIADYIFEEVQPSPRRCVGHPMEQTELVFVDGATGAASRPMGPIDDLCWTRYGYATHQLAVGSAYIGDFLADSPGNEVVVFPYYAKTGWVFTFDLTMGWRRHPKVLTYPSTPAFDRLYNATNSQPCQNVPGEQHCYHKYSHVSNGIFIGDNGTAPLLVLTSNRAVFYRSDFTPTGDYVWGYPEGGGRDYGLVESHDIGNAKTVMLIGGCSVAKTHDSMLTGRLSQDNCGLFRHYEYFLVRGQSIVRHAGRSYGWYGTVGRWQQRVEFPFPSAVNLAGGDSLWTIFNLYRDGQWRLQVLADPSRPYDAIETPGWFAWGSVRDRGGRALLVATRTSRTTATSVQSYIPPWEFDFLRWSGGKLVSVGHQSGVVPSLVLYPPGTDYHVTDGDAFGLLQTPWPMGLSSLLVESPNGAQSFVSVP